MSKEQLSFKIYSAKKNEDADRYLDDGFIITDFFSKKIMSIIWRKFHE